MSAPDHQHHSLPAEKEIHLLDYLHVVLRRWRIVLLLFLVVFVGVAVRTFLQTPIYQAQTILRIGYKAQASQELLQRFKENRFSIDSEIQVLTSYATAEKAATKLSLDWKIAKSDPKLDVHLRTLTVPDDLDEISMLITGPGEYELRDTQGKLLLEGVSEKLSSTAGVSAYFIIHKGRKGHSARLTRIGQAAAIGRVMSGVQAQEMGEGTNMLLLTVQGPDPMQTADVANALAEAYYEQSRESKAEEATMMLQFIGQQLGGLGEDLDRSEHRLQAFRIQTGLERLSPEGQSLVDAAVALEKEKAELTLRAQRISGFLQVATEDTFDFASIEDVPGVKDYVKQLLELRAVHIDLLRKYTPSHPAVIEIDDQMRQVRENIVASARLAQKSLEQKISDLEKALEESSRRLKQVPEEELELVRLSRSSQVNAELYSYLLQRQQETRIMAAATTSNVEIIDRAQVPVTPIKPNKKKSLALGLILGAMLGVGLAFLLDYIDRTIKDEDDVKENLGLTVLGTIPRIPGDEQGHSRQLVTQLDPFSSHSEAFLALRTNLLYIIANQKHRTALLSSCLLGEGKSTIAANLAVALAQTGAKILLVDCDLRRPSLDRIFGEERSPGLTDLLLNNDMKAIRTIPQANFDFIPAGTEPPNPTQLLGSDRMKSFLEKAQSRYDFVLIDAPPLLPVADALILASRADLNVLVLESCRVPVKLAKRALESLQRHGANIAGAVINDKTGKGARYYGPYSYYTGRYYQGYYRQETMPAPVPLWRRAMLRIWEFINN